MHGCVVQTLVGTSRQFQASKAAWQCCVVQALFEICAKCQVLKAAWQSRVVQALVEPVAECQALKAAWQNRVVHPSPLLHSLADFMRENLMRNKLHYDGFEQKLL